jgi:biopolymer transport protein ExbD/biopolymer transport protein TolR
MRRRQSLRANAELNLVNIIDVIFAILVVFMITAPLSTQGVTVDLPKAPSPSVDEQKTLEITVTRQREVFIGKGVSSLRDFERDFRVAFDGDPETAILVRADRAVPYGIVMEIVSAVNRQGGRKLGFLTSPEAQDSGTAPAPIAAAPGRP